MSIKHILGYELSWKTAAVSSRILVWYCWLSVPSNHSLNVWRNKQSFKLTWVKSPHVFLQFRWCDKFGVAFRLWTFVRSLAWNAQKYRKMPVKSICPVRQETRAAHPFICTSLTSVFTCVGNERGRHREGHATQVALVRFLPSVSSLVVRQRAGLSERLAADVTDVRFLPAVQSVGNVLKFNFIYRTTTQNNKCLKKSQVRSK